MLKYPISFSQIENNLIKSTKELQKQYKVIRKNGLSPFADPNSELLNKEQKILVSDYQNISKQYEKNLSEYSTFVEYIPNSYAPESKKNGIYTPPTDPNLFLYMFLISFILIIICAIVGNLVDNIKIKDFFESLMFLFTLPLGAGFGMYGMRKI